MDRSRTDEVARRKILGSRVERMKRGANRFFLESHTSCRLSDSLVLFVGRSGYSRAAGDAPGASRGVVAAHEGTLSLFALNSWN